MSDNESEMSRGSARSGRSHNSQHRKHRRHRSRHRSRDSEHGGSEHGSNYTYNDKYSVPPELVDSGKQWLEVQRQQAEKNSMGSVQKASVIKSTVPNVASTDTYNRKHKHRKHRFVPFFTTKLLYHKLPTFHYLDHLRITATRSGQRN